MSAPVKEGFPFTPLSSEEQSTIYELCGGDLPELEKMRFFLRVSGYEAIPDGWFRTYLQHVGLTCLEALGVDVTDTAARTNLNRGLLFYAGAVNTVGAIDYLPHHQDILQAQKEKNPNDLGTTAYQEANDLKAFRALFARYGKEFGYVGAYSGFDVALVGAGLAHIILTETSDMDTPAEVAPADGPEIDPDELLRGTLANFEMRQSELGKVADVFNARDAARDAFIVKVPSKKHLDPLPYLGEHDRRPIKTEGYYHG